MGNQRAVCRLEVSASKVLMIIDGMNKNKNVNRLMAAQLARFHKSNRYTHSLKFTQIDLPMSNDHHPHSSCHTLNEKRYFDCPIHDPPKLPKFMPYCRSIGFIRETVMANKWVICSDAKGAITSIESMKCKNNNAGYVYKVLVEMTTAIQAGHTKSL